MSRQRAKVQVGTTVKGDDVTNKEKEIFDLQVQIERLQVQIEVLTATLWKAKVLPLAEWHLPNSNILPNRPL